MFGFNVDEINTRLSNFVEGLPVLATNDADQVLYKYYETSHGLFDHRDRAKLKTRPLASVALHEAEENTLTSALYESIDIFIDNNVATRTGMSMQEFFQLPREIFNKTLMACRDKQVKDNREVDKVNAKAEKMFDTPPEKT